MENFNAIFNKINEIITNRYALFKEKCIDWDIIVNKHSSLIKNITDSKTFVNEIDDMLSELNDPHLRFTDITYRPQYFFPLSCSFVNNKIVTIGENNLVPKGSLLIELNSININTFISEMFSKYKDMPISYPKIRGLEYISTKPGKNINVKYFYNNNIFDTILDTEQINYESIENKDISQKILNFLFNKTISENTEYFKLLSFRKDTSKNVYDYLKQIKKI